MLKNKYFVLAFFLFGAVIVFFISAKIDLLEEFVIFSQSHEDLELDEIIPLILYAFIFLCGYSLFQWRQLFQLNKELSSTTRDLLEAQQEVKILEGILPICAQCKKIRDDKGYWNNVESYVSEHSTALFSHGICPNCAKKLYPEEYAAMYGEDLSKT